MDNGCDKPPPPSSPVTKYTNCSTVDKPSTNNDALTAIALVGTVVLVSVCIFNGGSMWCFCGRRKSCRSNVKFNIDIGA